MVDTVFDRTERGLGSTSLSVADIVAKTRGNPNEIMKLVVGGQINLTQGLLAKRLSDSVVAEQQKAAMPQSTVLQDAFPQMAQSMGGLQPPAQPPTQPPMQGAASPQGMAPMPPAPAPQPQMQAPQGMAEGGLAQLDFAAPEYASGGIVAFQDGGRIDLERLRRAIVAQESGGDYGIENTEGSGAMGAYQFMPDTARALARRLGLDYRPELLRGDRGRSEEGREYQDALGTASLQEAIDFSGGDLSRAAAYHFAGPNERGWRENTARYQRQLAERYGGDGESEGGTPASTGDRQGLMTLINEGLEPEKVDPSSYLEQLRRLAPNETEATDRYRASLEAAPDPEKARQRAELGALFEAIGNVQPGMSPLEALAQGFSTSGASIQAAETRAATQESERLQAAAQLENLRNQMTREEFQLATQLAQYDAGRLDAATGRQLEAMLSIAGLDSQEKIAAARNLIEQHQIDTGAAVQREQIGAGKQSDLLRTLVALNRPPAGAETDLATSLNMSSGGGGGGGSGEAPAAAGAGRIVSAVPIPQ